MVVRYSCLDWGPTSHPDRSPLARHRIEKYVPIRCINLLFWVCIHVVLFLYEYRKLLLPYHATFQSQQLLVRQPVLTLTSELISEIREV
jgi:hypothetical protein